MHTLKTLHQISCTALMAALIAAGSLFTVALGPVPVTFQEAFVTLSGLVLGPVRGFLATALYLLVGCAGMPVFSGGKSGIMVLFGPTGGYLIGFLFLAIFAGIGSRMAKIRQANKPLSYANSALAFAWVLLGLCVMYFFGVLGLMQALDFSMTNAITVGVLPFIPIAFCKMLLMTLLWRKIQHEGFFHYE